MQTQKAKQEQYATPVFSYFCHLRFGKFTKDKNNMAGIYIHIPFCRKACHYCNFHFSTSTKQIDEMVQAICNEAILRRNYINENISTVYFGGGTPSLLSVDELQVIGNQLHELFTIDADAEITQC